MPPDLPTATVLPGTLARPDPLALSFGGFTAESFDALGRLRERPNVEQYRADKAALDVHVWAPFRAYRDDLAVNLVLPNRLPWETERNVFSRLLKNDFGAGGSHHHVWMSFYRTGRKRLTDPQLSHSIDPDGFTVGLYAGDHAGDYLARIKARALAEPEVFGALLRGALADPAWRAFAYTGTGANEVRHDLAAGDPDAALVKRMRGVWVRRTFARADVLAWGPDLVRHSLGAVDHLWPLYRLFADATA